LKKTINKHTKEKKMKTTPILIRFDDELLTIIDDLSIKERRSRNNMVNVLIEKAIKEIYNLKLKG